MAGFALRREDIAARLALFSRAPAPERETPLKPAAVAIAILEGEEGLDFLLTRRAGTLRAHRGQWALPGGRCDPGEEAAAAALRELEEELGLRPAADDVLGCLDDYPTRSGYLITPVVVWLGAAPELRPNPAEVASVHRIPLGAIVREEAVDFMSIPESDRPLIRLHINGSTIHAPTAALIYQFREVLAGRATRVADLEQPLFAWR
ncbi:MAG TPA: CoA pyrophosphatase [Xanthobacteraceae bacterium]|nr:CoA pyrophosphatase [Xanthobacteraceae bacterium]